MGALSSRSCAPPRAAGRAAVRPPASAAARRHAAVPDPARRAAARRRDGHTGRRRRRSRPRPRRPTTASATTTMTLEIEPGVTLDGVIALPTQTPRKPAILWRRHAARRRLDEPRLRAAREGGERGAAAAPARCPRRLPPNQYHFALGPYMPLFQRAVAVGRRLSACALTTRSAPSTGWRRGPTSTRGSHRLRHRCAGDGRAACRDARPADLARRRGAHAGVSTGTALQAGAAPEPVRGADSERAAALRCARPPHRHLPAPPRPGQPGHAMPQRARSRARRFSGPSTPTKTLRTPERIRLVRAASATCPDLNSPPRASPRPRPTSPDH